MPKRKRAKTPPPTASTAVTTKSAVSQKKTFPFLNLPAELRNNIYEKALEDDGARLLTKPKRSSNKKQRKVWQNSLWLPRAVTTFLVLNKQIHNEFMHIAATAAPIRTKVIDFNSPTSSPSPTAWAKPTSKKLESDKSKQQIMIELDFADGCYLGADLVRWLNRMEYSEKNGSNLDYNYTTDLVRAARSLTLDGSTEQEAAEGWLEVVRGALSQAREYLRYQEEGKKIESALEVVRRGDE